MESSNKQQSVKRLLIDKANSTMLIVIGVAAFLSVFSLVASRSLINQSRYQAKVIKEKKIALNQLKANNTNVEKLVESYKAFAARPQNILEGNPSGTGPKDGDNPKLVLDALPSKYDFPAVISSMEKVLKESGYIIKTLGGSDDEVVQQASGVSDSPTPIEMPFPIGVTTTQDLITPLLVKLEKSIRPIYVSKITITATNDGIELGLGAKTFYQPEKTLKVTTKVIK